MWKSLVLLASLLVLLLAGCDLVYQSVGKVLVRVENNNTYSLENVGGVFGNDTFGGTVGLSFNSQISDGAGGTIPVTATEAQLQDPAGWLRGPDHTTPKRC